METSDYRYYRIARAGRYYLISENSKKEEKSRLILTNTLRILFVYSRFS